MQRVLGGLKEGIVFVISAPAGTGKTTLVRMLTQEFDCVLESISYTTRKPRSGEVEDLDYHFINTDAFEKRIEEGDFLEYASVYGEYYGTSKRSVQEMQKSGKHVVLVIDTQGALQLMDRLEAVFIFISPPSLEELKKRLLERRADSEASIEKRLSWAKKEMEVANRYDYLIVNDQLHTAYEILRSIFIAEEHRVSLRKDLI